MKKAFATIALVILVIVSASAQTQSGYVKTKGRMDKHGNVIPGDKISGVAIELKDGHSTVSGDNGIFTITVPAQTYTIKNVYKNGYYLYDPEMLLSQHFLSPNPLEIVMIDKKQEEEYKKKIELQVTTRFYNQLSARDDSIEYWKNQNKITEEKYQELTRQLEDDKKNSDKEVRKMVDYFVNIDFDNVNETKRIVSDCILNGDLEKAKRILKDQVDDVDKVANELDSMRVAIEEEQNELNKNQAALESKKSYYQWRINESADYYYQYAEIYKLQYQWDSVRFYLERRANLDEKNIQWQLDAGECLSGKARDFYYFRALQQALLQYGPVHHDVASCYMYIGDVLDEQLHKLELYNKALAIYEKIYDTVHPDIAHCYYKMAEAYGEDSVGLSCLYRALEIYQACYETENHIEIANVYFSLGEWYFEKLRFHLDRTQPEKNEFFLFMKEYFINALNIEREVYGEGNILLSETYNNIGYVYRCLYLYDYALEFYLKALDINSDSTSYDVYRNYCEIAHVYLCLSDPWASDFSMPMFVKLSYLQQALDYHIKAYSTLRVCCDSSLAHSGGRNECEIQFGEMCNNITMDYCMIGSIYFQYGEYDKAITSFYKALQYADYKGFNYEYIEENSELYDDFFNMMVVFPPLIPNEIEYDFEKPTNYYEEFDILKVIADLYSYLNNDSMAIKCYNKLISTYYRPDSVDHFDDTYFDYTDINDSDDSTELASLYVNTGILYQHSGEDSLALACYNKALDLLTPILGDNKKSIAICYIHIAEILSKNNLDNKALFYAQTALSLLKDLDSPLLRGVCYLIEGDVYKKQLNYKKSLGLYKNALRAYKISVRNQKQALEKELKISNSNLQDYKAAIDEYGIALKKEEKECAFSNCQALFDKENPVNLYPLFNNEYTISSYLYFYVYYYYFGEIDDWGYYADNYTMDVCTYNQSLRLGNLPSEIDQLSLQNKKSKHK